MTRGDQGRGPFVPRWVVWLALLAWSSVLLAWSSRANVRSVELSELMVRGTGGLAACLRPVVVQVLAHLALFIPVGMLAVFAFPSRETRLDRLLRRWVPAAAVTLLLALVVRAGNSPPTTIEPLLPTGTFELLACWAGGLLGTWAGMAWARGPRSGLLLLPKLALLVGLLGVGVGWLGSLALDRSPANIDMPEVTSADRRHLYALFAAKNPMNVPKGTIATLRLTTADLNLLLAWGLSLEGSPLRVRVDLHGSEAQFLASTPLFGRARFLNVTVEGGFAVREGTLALQADRLRLGHLELPRLVIGELSRLIARVVAADARAQPILARLHGLEVQSGALVLTYGPGAPPPGFVAKLFHDSAAPPLDVQAVRAQVVNLIAAAPTMPRDREERFGAAISAAFRLARERSSLNHAAEENRTAVLALGMALGHPRVETLLGGGMTDAPARRALERAFTGTTVRRRSDWPRHFFVSGALTVVTAENISIAGGLFKEEKDSAGGSGFSFGDLLADRAGTTFAEVATRNESSARALQDRLAHGFRLDDYFPEAKDLPEGLQAAEFQARYGGTDGEGYRRLVAEIDRRVSSCPAYRTGP